MDVKCGRETGVKARSTLKTHSTPAPGRDSGLGVSERGVGGINKKQLNKTHALTQDSFELYDRNRA